MKGTVPSCTPTWAAQVQNNVKQNSAHGDVTKRSISRNTDISHITWSLNCKRGKINFYTLTFARTLDVASSQALLISPPSFPESRSIYTSVDSLFFLPMVRQETTSNTSNARPLRAKNRSCAMLDIFLSASYTPSSCSIFSIGGGVWCRLNQKVVFHGLPAAIRQDSLPSGPRLAHDCAAVGLTFQNYHQSSIGTRLQSLLNKGLLTWREPQLFF